MENRCIDEIWIAKLALSDSCFPIYTQRQVLQQWKNTQEFSQNAYSYDTSRNDKSLWINLFSFLCWVCMFSLCQCGLSIRCTCFHLPQPRHVHITLIGNSKLLVVRVHLAVCLCVLTINCPHCTSAFNHASWTCKALNHSHRHLNGLCTIKKKANWSL